MRFTSGDDRRPVALRTRDRGASTNLAHLLTLGLTTVLIAGLLVSVNSLVTNQEQRAVRNEIKVVGESVAGKLMRADTMVGRDRSTTVRFSLDLPRRIADDRYTVALRADGDGAWVNVTSTKTSQRVTVPFNNETRVSNVTHNGGDLHVVKTGGILTLVQPDADPSVPSVNNPILTDVTDGNGKVTDGDTVEIAVDASDPDGIGSVTGDASAFGAGTVTLTDGDGDGTYDATVTVNGGAAAGDGDRSVSITVSDTVGYTASTSAGPLVLDTTDPSATVTSPNSGAIVSNDQESITIEVTDATAGVDWSSVEVTAFDSDTGDGQEFSNANVGDPGVTRSGNTITVDPATAGVTWADGTVTVDVTAEDEVGQSDDVTGHSFTVNANAPTITNPTITDATDGDGHVRDADTVTVSADVSDPDGVSSVNADASDFGAGTVALTDGDADGTYDATFTVDEATAAADGDYDVLITATDTLGSTATATTNTLTLDTTDPTLSGATLTDQADGNGVVNDGETVEVVVSVSDASPISSVEADASDFGAGTVTLTDGDSDGTYDTTFTVNVGGATDGSHSVQVTAEDQADNGDSTTSTSLTLDSTAPSTSSASATDITDGDGTVGDTDNVTVSIDASDATTSVASVEADASDFGAGTVALTDGDDDGTYDATFTVDAGSASADGDYAIPITTTDVAGNSVTTDTNQLTLSTVTVTIDSFTLDADNSQCKGNNCNGKDNAAYDFSWQTSGASSVTVYVNNTDDGNTFTTYNSLDGSGSFQESGDYDDDYEIKLVASAGGTTECEVWSGTADGSTADETKSTC